MIILTGSKYPLKISYPASYFFGHHDPEKTKLPIIVDCRIFWIQNGFCVSSAMTLVRLYLLSFLRVKSGSVG